MGDGEVGVRSDHACSHPQPQERLALQQQRLRVFDQFLDPH